MSLYYFLFLPALLTTIEAIYSLHKKDNIYSIRGTLGAFAHDVWIRILLEYIKPIILSYILLLYTSKNSYNDLTLLSIIYCFIVLDFLNYVYHKMCHSFEFMWMVHYSHHGDSKFNISTPFRNSLIHRSVSFFIIGIILVMMGFGEKTILLCFIISNIYQLICHSQYIKIPKIFEKVLITPRTHKIHHSIQEIHQQKNMGSVFSVWDKLFGSYIEKIDKFEAGIKNYHQDNFIKIETDPILQYLKNKTPKH